MRFLFIPLLFAACLHAQSPARTGKDYAVFFYVTQFQTGWPALPETKTESEQIKTELERNYGFSCELVPNPTRQQILDKLAAWNRRLGPADQILYYFSMHGHYDPASDLGHLVAADGLANDPYFDTYLNYNRLRAYFTVDKCKARHVLVALDACHSGSFGDRLRSRPDQPDYTDAPDCAARIGTAFAYAGRQFVCSGNKDAKTPARSSFAARFLEALRSGPDRQGLLAFDDLAYQLGKIKNPEPENGTFAGHNPGGDFLFIRKNACAILPSANADRDGDGIPDSQDACPQDYGTAKARGCPDADDDGVPDHSDQCKYLAGLARWQGCPDTDGDGVPDHQDKCPKEKGDPAREGCPEVIAGVEDLGQLYSSVYYITVEKIVVSWEGAQESEIANLKAITNLRAFGIWNVDLNSAQTKIEDYKWTGTGFLLTDGRFVTARHIIEPWYFFDTKDVDAAEMLFNLYCNNGGEIVTYFTAYAPDGKKINFKSTDFVVDRSGDESIIINAPDSDATALVSHAKPDDGKDWASYQTSRTGLIRYSASLSRSLPAKAKLHVLGYPIGLGANSRSDLQPEYGTCTVSREGLNKGIILITDRNYEHGSSGGPAFYLENGRYVAVGIITTAVGIQSGYIVPLSAIR